MKHYFYLLLVLPFFGFSQNNSENYDYFVQFNIPQFAKKVNIDSLLNHKAFKEFNREGEKLQLKDFSSFMDMSQPAVIHGNFTDSISYYQFTFPIKDVAFLENFIQTNIEKNNETATDSVYEEIITKANYSLFTPKNSDFTMAWNKNYLIFYQIIEKAQPYNNYGYDFGEAEEVVEEYDYDEDYDEESEFVEEEVIVESSEEKIPPPPPPVVEIISAEEWENSGEVIVESTEYDEEYDEEYEDDYDYEEFQKQYEAEQRELKKERVAQQEIQIELLFANGFSMPTSTKINNTADISSWLNYQSAYAEMQSLTYMFRSFSKMNPNTEYDNVIKGMTVDMNFENDKAVMEQTIEYSKPLANIVKKLVNRKINKRIYNYFPQNKPLGYMSYHFNTEEMLKNYPAIAEQMLGSLPLDKKDTEIITELFSTFIDEEAVATLFDGDFSMFFHGMDQYESTFTSYSYDDDYNEIEEEQTITKTRPIFTFIMTSTHPKMATKLIDMGLRKGLMVAENGYYTFQSAGQEMEGLKLIKDKDVIVFTNGIEYLNANSTSDFSRQIKKELKKNYIVGNLDMKKFLQEVVMTNDMGSDTAKIIQVSNQFENLSFKSGKKLNDNKMKLEMMMKSSQNDKNIVLQTLDLISYFQ